MKKYLVVLMTVLAVMFSGTAMAQLTMPEIEGNFKYLPIDKVLTLGTSAVIADFSKDDSATPLELSAIPKKLLYSSSLKGTVAWNITGKSQETGLIPDYGGIEASVDIMQFLTNAGANINTDVALSIDTGLLFGLSKLLDNPATLDLQPAIGASLKIKF